LRLGVHGLVKAIETFGPLVDWFRVGVQLFVDVDDQHQTEKGQTTDVQNSQVEIEEDILIVGLANGYSVFGDGLGGRETNAQQPVGLSG
jgi:hypothetical protein